MTLVRFNRWEDKQEIMAKKKKIEKARKIFMDDDLTATERQIQKHLGAYEKGTQERKSRGRIITAVNKNLKFIEVREISDEVVESRLEYNGNKWRIITLYSQKMKDTMETLREKVQEEDEEGVLVKGDFNARTGSKGGPINEEEENEKRSETRKMEGKEKKIEEIVEELEEGRIGKEEYVREKKEHKKWCKEQKGRHESEEEEKIRNIKNEAEAWKYINKYKKKKAEGISEEMHMDE
ncbi:ABC transporter F family member 4-like [Temnothorax curvispinosus]|uniref:ABC transporter F family member 4-like n=1 Tax=Temnothorax curvispinosus TaxID=300111 RepID=A0A6J1QHE2_9HYME|nr:ABC transporter F family member 4-like [Temnothorax curvispinosus]